MGLKIKIKKSLLKKVGKKKEERDKAGHPTLYKPKYCKEIVKFFDVKAYKSETVEAFGRTFTKKIGNDLPTFEAFARKIGVCRDTLYQWRKDNIDFRTAFDLAKNMQSDILITNGLHGGYNTAFSIFAAKNMLGWKDKVDHSSLGRSMSLMSLFNAAKDEPTE